MNLIICCTPLQVLIAEKIMENYPKEKFFGVMLHTVDNSKFSHYKARLKSKCQAGFFSLLQHNDRINLLKEIIRLKFFFTGKSFVRVFVANFTELHIQFLLSSVKFEQFYTFDDGTVNIVENSPFLRNDPKTPMRKMINCILGNRFSNQKLRTLSQKHYTIYQGFPNIIKNTEGIDLIENSESNSDDVESVNILLGQPVYAADDANIALAEKVIKKFNIHYYFPHPREKYKLSNISYINTPLIFEDYIISKFSKRKCKVYTYFSSAILNLNNKSPNIDMAALKIETHDPAFDATYALFEKLGINVIDIRE
ncbi:glycosyltransferase family 52 [Bibersteinia trehalosi]|uniref:CMP-N-acetylneuraminate-beta-galactosamide-alpha-2, 3-sialyltransferase n=1 Tax=Bibersteinia trehalosi TaxID=47735 RepID=A0A426FIB8_BIBTR|nr:glycosyltransferase family 52 [Bibersteinia trehalosi]RRN04496.1 CMP-N-acetylneuraminate-beta-galactosamide-alpha-2, 3-sialyltransferase [Bibersteinia trehalosi]